MCHFLKQTKAFLLPTTEESIANDEGHVLEMLQNDECFVLLRKEKISQLDISELNLDISTVY